MPIKGPGSPQPLGLCSSTCSRCSPTAALRSGPPLPACRPRRLGAPLSRPPPPPSPAPAAGHTWGGAQGPRGAGGKPGEPAGRWGFLLLRAGGSTSARSLWLVRVTRGRGSRLQMSPRRVCTVPCYHPLNGSDNLGGRAQPGTFFFYRCGHLTEDEQRFPAFRTSKHHANNNPHGLALSPRSS